MKQLYRFTYYHYDVIDVANQIIYIMKHADLFVSLQEVRIIMYYVYIDYLKHNIVLFDEPWLCWNVSPMVQRLWDKFSGYGSNLIPSIGYQEPFIQDDNLDDVITSVIMFINRRKRSELLNLIKKDIIDVSEKENIELYISDELSPTFLCLIPCYHKFASEPKM